MMIDVLTLFPKTFRFVLGESIIKRAVESGLVEINVRNLREWTHDKRKTVDDKPFGGGAGMVMKPEPVFEAVADLKTRGARVVLLTPQGETFSQRTARRLSRYKHIILISGHYEGFDERVREHLATDEISIGDYILTGGELPAMVVIDAVVRLLPDVLGHEDSARYESFEDGLLEHPQYTRPSEYRGMRVPKILLSGDHKKIEKWRMEQAIKRTRKRRPDLLTTKN